MGLYIKGMEMPEAADEFIEVLIFGDGKVTQTGKSWRCKADGKCYYESITPEAFFHAIPASDEASHQQVIARWYKPTGMMPPEFTGRHRCSACDGFAMHDWKHHREQLTPFCPHCGAKMENGDSEL